MNRGKTIILFHCFIFRFVFPLSLLVIVVIIIIIFVAIIVVVIVIICHYHYHHHHQERNGLTCVYGRCSFVGGIVVVRVKLEVPIRSKKLL